MGLFEEQGAAAKTESEVRRLRQSTDEAVELTNHLRIELDAQQRQNGELEEACDQATKELEHAEAARELARQRLDNRSETLRQLRVTIRDHSRQIVERLGLLEQSLGDVQDKG